MYKLDLNKTEERTLLLGKENASLIDLYVKDKTETLDKIEDPKIKEAAKASWVKEQKEAETISRAVQGLCNLITPLLAICDMACMIDAQPSDSELTIFKINDLNKYGKKVMDAVAGSRCSDIGDIPEELMILLRLMGKALR